MFTWLIIITVLAVLYGLAWHNEPPRQRETVARPRDTQNPLPK